jgi:uncharacterized repeat protein (TIGR03987 family)
MVRLLEVLFCVAFALYSIAIFAQHYTKRFELWMVLAFSIALTMDTVSTVVLCCGTQDGWRWTPHAISGLAALVVMALHFSWLLCASRNIARFGPLFNRFSVFAWWLWVIAFASGIPFMGAEPA